MNSFVAPSSAGSNGCAASAVPVTVAANANPPAPTITAGGPTTFCAGGSVTLTAVQVSRDLSHATVYFLPFEASRDRERVGRALNHAGGFLRHALKDHMKLHHIPELKFLPDESIERMARLSALITSAVASDESRTTRRTRRCPSSMRFATAISPSRVRSEKDTIPRR